jgi:hypothetical protein
MEKKIKGMYLGVTSSFYIDFLLCSKIMKGILDFLCSIIIFLIKKPQTRFPHASVCGSARVFWATRAVHPNDQIYCSVVS